MTTMIWKRWLGALMASLLLGVPSVAFAQGPGAPLLIPYRGTLVNADGEPLGSPTPRNYDVVFRIHDASSGGTLLWSEQQTVTVDGGRYGIQLGLGGAYGTEPRPELSSVFRTATASDRFVEVTVKGIGSGGADSTLQPRVRLLPGAYAMMSRHARTTEALVNGARGNVISLVGAKVGINTTNPVTALEVVGSTRSDGIQVEGDGAVRGVATAASWVGGGAAPVGSIIMWSGAAVDRPSGWAFCDGSVVNGYRTPDLRGRFVLGAGAGPGLTERIVAQTGGEETHALAMEELPVHRHVFDPPQSFTSAAGAHSHTFNGEINGSGKYAYVWVTENGVVGASGNQISARGFRAEMESSEAHRHEANLAPTASATVGAGQPHPNLPPFYVLAYLVRIQ